jgi:hypothetical protein
MQNKANFHPAGDDANSGSENGLWRKGSNQGSGKTKPICPDKAHRADCPRWQAGELGYPAEGRGGALPIRAEAGMLWANDGPYE